MARKDTEDFRAVAPAAVNTINSLRKVPDFSEEPGLGRQMALRQLTGNVASLSALMDAGLITQEDAIMTAIASKDVKQVVDPEPNIQINTQLDNERARSLLAALKKIKTDSDNLDKHYNKGRKEKDKRFIMRSGSAQDTLELLREKLKLRR